MAKAPTVVYRELFGAEGVGQIPTRPDGTPTEVTDVWNPIKGEARETHQNVWDRVAALEGSDYASLSALAAAIASGFVPADGQRVTAGDLSYLGSAGATTISDLPGLVPMGDVYPDHFADNTIPGTTDMSAAILAARAYSKTVYLRGVEYRFNFSTTDGISPQAGQRIIGEPGAVLKFVPDSSSYRSLFSLPNGDFAMEGVKVTSIAQPGQTIAYFSVKSSGMRFKSCDFDGAITDDGVSASHLSYLFSWPETGTQNDFHVEDCEVYHFNLVLLKTNTATSTQRNMRFINNRVHDNYAGAWSFNSPNGICDDVLISGDRFYYDGTADLSVISVNIFPVAFARCTNFRVIGCQFETAAGCSEAIHLEDGNADYVITGNNISTFTKGIVSLDNDISGVDLVPENGVISDNTITKLGTQKEAGSIGIDLIFDASPEIPARRSSVSRNMIRGFEFGIVSDTESADAVTCDGNIISACAVGIRETAMGQWRGNITADCDVDIRSLKSGHFEGHTFVNPMQAVDATDRPVTLVDPSWRFDSFEVNNTTVAKNLIALGASDRADGALTYSAWTVTGSTDNAFERFTVGWDGTTYTATQAYSVQPGGLAVGTSHDGTNMRITAFHASLRTVHLAASFSGAMVIV